MLPLQLVVVAGGVVAPWLAWIAGRRSRRAAWAIVLPLVLLASLWFVLCGPMAGSRLPLGTELPGVVESQWTLPPSDIDVRVLTDGFRAAPRLRDTTSWWAGRWVGQNEFWRPLSSYLLWAEWRAFGPAGWRWAAVSILLAVALAAVTLWALSPLLGEGGAAAAVLATFAGLWTPWPRWTPMGPVVGLWKNQPDILAGLFILGAVGWAARGRLALAAAASCTAVACKELGFTAFLLAPLAIAWAQRFRGVPCDWRRVAGYFVPAALVLAVWHYQAVGIGHRIGTNASWPYRALIYYGGLPAGLWRGGTAWIVVVGAFWGLRLPLLLKRPLRALVVVIAGAGAAAGLVAWQRGETHGVALAIVILHWNETLAMALWAWTARLAWRRQAPALALGTAWMVIGAAPAFAAAQVQAYARWLGSLGQGIMVAAAIGAILEELAPAAVGKVTANVRNRP